LPCNSFWKACSPSTWVDSSIDGSVEDYDVDET
jgi:hypothetical protein